MKNRNLNISPSYIDNVLGGQVRFLNLSASAFDDRYLRLYSTELQAVTSSVSFLGDITLESTSSFHVVSLNSHLILSSSFGSKVAISGAVKIRDIGQTTLLSVGNEFGDGVGSNVLVSVATSQSAGNYAGLALSRHFNTGQYITIIQNGLNIGQSPDGTAAQFFIGSAGGVDRRVGIGTITPLSYFDVIPFTPTGSVAHFVTGLGTNPVTIGRTQASGTQVLSVRVDDSTVYIDGIQDEETTQMLFSLTTGSTGAGGTGVQQIPLRLVLDQLGGRVGINRTPPTTGKSFEVQGDTLTTGDFTGSGGFKSILGPFVDANRAANTKTEMGLPPLTTAGASRWIAPYAGSIIGITARESAGANVTAASITFSASINGAANATLVVTVAAATNGNRAVFAKDAVTFAAGDTLGIFAATAVGYTPTTNDYAAFLIIEH